MSSEQLREYQRRRDLDSSGEPAGGEPSVGDFPLFVIQRHEATALHFDVRLEIGGVLVSWAVPKGPSTNPSDKRLAVRTEDHPMDYATFEGRIGEGYGAGTVVVWDTGPYVGTTRKADQDVPLVRRWPTVISPSGWRGTRSAAGTPSPAPVSGPARSSGCS